MPAPTELTTLINRFERNLDDYRSGHYNETQVRREFIDPFLKLLGWDVDNTKGYAEQYKDVVHEDAIKVGGSTKAPDYSLRIGGQRKLFVEAKKPSVNIKQDIAPAFQVRRYAWSAKLPLSILTDFEELAVYDCRDKPNKTDKASHARIMYFTFRDYADKWDKLMELFSPQAIMQGAFDKFIQSSKKKRGTAEVDDAFLAEISVWRDELARNIALRNPGIKTRSLNHAVQRTIDRLIFLRIAEDRGIEPYGRLRDRAGKANVYQNLTYLFRQADAKYNSGLFHFKTERGRDEASLDTFTLDLALDDKPLRSIIKRLYYPDSPYQFDVIPADILGQVYEQFLGKVIRLTPKGQAKVEEKPEVKKAGGVFYTPTYIVDYIVQQTVGKLVEGKKPGKAGAVSKLRILDPACGSGSFLIGAYQFLLDWHLNEYVQEPERWARGKEPALMQNGSGEWRLTIGERKRILLNNIYGVDIDQQAVEVTKLSLLLKVMEGENEQTMGTQLSLLPERVLPDLSANIQCGNSLIGPDFYDGQMSLGIVDEEEMYRINVFDWDAAFPTIVPWGGFDAVIGNPPYIRMEFFKDWKNYLRTNYKSHDERSDLYAYFIEKAHNLLRTSGNFGMIVSNKFLKAKYGKPLREFLRQNASVSEVVDFAGLPVFKGATVRTIVLHTTKNNLNIIHYTPPLNPDLFNLVDSHTVTVEDAIKIHSYQVAQNSLEEDVWTFAKEEVRILMSRLKGEHPSLDKNSSGNICRGVVSGLTKAFVINAKIRNDILSENPQADEIIKPFLNGRDVRRYQLQPKDLYLIYTFHGVDIKRYPAVEAHLKPFKDRLVKRATRQEWYELQQPQFKFSQYMDNPKIIFPDIATEPRFTLDEKGFYSSNTTYFIPIPDLFLLGLLNSRLGKFYFVTVCAGLEGKNENYLRFFGQYLSGFPVVNLEDSSKEKQQVAMQTRQMLELHKRLAAAQTAHERTLLQRQIAATDRQIDQLVYQLYDLTPAEIAIVEGQS